LNLGVKGNDRQDCAQNCAKWPLGYVELAVRVKYGNPHVYWRVPKDPKYAKVLILRQQVL
jgi:hypothetical protein